MPEETHHILFYEYVEDILDRRGPHRDGHLAAIRQAREAGQVGLAGAIGEPIHGGVIVFKGVEPAEIEAFVQADPYVQAGLVKSWRVERWNLV